MTPPQLNGGQNGKAQKLVKPNQVVDPTTDKWGSKRRRTLMTIENEVSGLATREWRPDNEKTPSQKLWDKHY